MPPRSVLPAVLAAVLLAGCGGGTVAEVPIPSVSILSPTGTPTPTPTPSDTPSPTPSTSPSKKPPPKHVDHGPVRWTQCRRVTPAALFDRMAATMKREASVHVVDRVTTGRGQIVADGSLSLLEGGLKAQFTILRGYTTRHPEAYRVISVGGRVHYRIGAAKDYQDAALGSPQQQAAVQAAAGLDPRVRLDTVGQSAAGVSLVGPTRVHGERSCHYRVLERPDVVPSKPNKPGKGGKGGKGGKPSKPIKPIKAAATGIDLWVGLAGLPQQTRAFGGAVLSTYDEWSMALRFTEPLPPSAQD